jgi:hypothetical protein
MTDTFIKLPNPSYKERSSFTVTAYFRDSSDAAEAPTTVHYRIDDISRRNRITDWTSVTPGVSVSITVTATENKVYNHNASRQRRQITVAADKGLDGETRDTAEWFVENIEGFDE